MIAIIPPQMMISDILSDWRGVAIHGVVLVPLATTGVTRRNEI
jgi:hypothetical protein